MPLLNWKSGLIVSALLTAFIAGCGTDKSKSGLVTVALSPSQPIVISADSATKKAPWFDFKVVITNGSSSTLRIVGLQIDLELTVGTEKDTGSAGYSPSDYSTAFSNSTMICVYDYLGTISPGQTKELTLVKSSSSNASCPTDTPITFTFIDGPKITGSESYRYRGTVTPQGWFENADGSLERFTRSGVFSTQ